MPDAGIRTKSFERSRILGDALLTIGVAISIASGAWPAALGIVLGGLVTLGWMGKFVKRALEAAQARKRNPEASTQATFIIRTVTGCLPTAIVGLAAILIGVTYPIALVPGGFFLAMATSLLCLYKGLWSSAKIPTETRP